MSQAHEEIQRTVPKAAEYGSGDLIEIGRVMAETMRIDQGHHLTEGALAELGIYFYLVGKMARWTDAVKTGRRVSDDTLFDLGVYVRMVQRVRAAGSWPGVDLDTDQDNDLRAGGVGPEDYDPAADIGPETYQANRSHRVSARRYAAELFSGRYWQAQCKDCGYIGPQHEDTSGGERGAECDAMEHGGLLWRPEPNAGDVLGRAWQMRQAERIHRQRAITHATFLHQHENEWGNVYWRARCSCGWTGPERGNTKAGNEQAINDEGEHLETARGWAEGRPVPPPINEGGNDDDA